MARAKKSHKDVEFMIEDPRRPGTKMYLKTADEASSIAIALAMSHGEKVYIDVLVSSRAGAKWYRGSSDGADEYDEDPDASVFERIVVRAENVGRVS